VLHDPSRPAGVRDRAPCPALERFLVEVVGGMRDMAQALGRRQVWPGLMMDFTVACDAPTGSAFDLAWRKAPEHYRRVAGYWWWGASGAGV
jgi:hypothetical protein